MENNLNSIKRKEFGQFLKRLRKQKAYSLRKAAQECNMPFSNLASIERGEGIKIKMSFLASFSALYRVDYDELCIMCERIPVDVFYKIVRHPSLIQKIRNMKV